MQLVVRSAGREREVDVEVRSPLATLGDLARAAGSRRPDGPVGVDGRVLGPDCPLADAGLLEGGLVDLDGAPAFVPLAVRAPYEVVAVAGLDAGGSWPLTDPVLVGRCATAQVRLADASISREHCRLAVDDAGRLQVTDLGARNAVAVDDRVLRRGERVTVDLGAGVRLGAVELHVRPRCDGDRPSGLDLPRQASPAGTVALNRPPRPPGAVPPLAPLLPAAPVAGSSEPLSWAAVLGPLAMAAVLVGLTGDARFALFSALSPVLVLGSWWESRRRGRRAGRRERLRYAAELTDLRAAVAGAALAERDRLRELAPDPAEVLRRARLPSTRLWERRPDDPGGLPLAVGTADQPWRPAAEPPARPPPEVRALLDAARLVAAPVLLDLSPGRVVGLVGDRAAVLAVARQLVCSAAVAAGPADLTLVVLAATADWAWARWLPHTRVPGGGSDRWLSAGAAGSEQLLRTLQTAGRLGSGGPGALVVLDDSALTTGRSAPARDLLAAARRPGPDGPRVAAIVLAGTRDALPAACDQVLEVHAGGAASLTRPAGAARVTGVLAAGLTTARARDCARDLARFDDPELVAPGAGLPASVRLLPLLELPHSAGQIDPAGVRARWASGGADPGAATALGVGERGLFVLDLVRDGAHGLIGGTTGSGKSELLRSLVAGLAVSADPEHLTFVLVDYKGGAAFDVCARLPHVVGLVTDLDEQLGARALTALEAELQARERVLRAAGADDLPGYLALGRPEPLPRLIVVIDEFATLAQELPGFVSALVGIAQRGRTLGVHLLLATQRPSGAVRDDIRANTNLRIALRVQDAPDSTDVLGTPLAAGIARDRPGRAYVRLGPGEVLPVQTGLVTCVSTAGADTPVEVRPAGTPSAASGAEPAPAGGRSDLERLVDAVVAAHAASGRPLPRRPWLPPLPDRLDLAALPAGRPGTAVVALADDPGRQRQTAAGWDLDEGGLLLLGVPGSGTTTALLALGLALAAACSPAELELYALDAGAGGLRALEELPHTGAVVPAGDRERQVRLVRRLTAELERRRGTPAGSRPRVVLLLDNLPALRAAHDDVDGLALLDLLARLHADGPEVGLCLALTADRPGAVPAPLAAVTTQRWLFRLADPGEHAAAGLARTDVPAAVPGRAVLLPSRLQAQVALPAPGLPGQIAARWAGASRAATPVRALPTSLTREQLHRPVRCEDLVWHLPVGLAEVDLAVAEVALHEGEGLLVAGPARSGRSTVLTSLAVGLEQAGVRVLATGSRRSPLRSGGPDRWVEPGELTAALAALVGGAGPRALVVDDAEGVDDPDGALSALLQVSPPGLRVLAAGRSDALRTAYGSWTSVLRRSRTGLLLQPAVDLDGDLLGVVLPRRAPVELGTARGYLVADGRVALVQAATASPA